jgi:lysozyme
MIPSSKPQASSARILSAFRKEWNKSHRGEAMPEFFVGFVRGYYFRTMGDPNKNDRGIYDDAAFVVGPNAFASFNANADPSIHRRGIATLIPGFYPYRPGNHGISRPGGGYPAFRPATPGEALPVTRDGEAAVPSSRPGIAINIHRGATRTTSSEGCLTIPIGQWDAFHALVTSEIRRLGLRRFWVGLTDGPIT